MLDDRASRRGRVLDLLVGALRRHPAAASAAVAEGTRLLETGVIDSTGLLDVILEVEAETGLSFDPLRLDLEGGLTLGMLADAFLPADAEAASG
ncbi:hypothetical protein [Falsiroseomonas sp. HW251]|uniref:hypothetical protein n=1 Tax=Falsiroseomonas sp. HW251 TaxID=3390998 RepID=UPI003D321849